MKYSKGQSGNPNGRPKGTPNKTSKQIREMITLFLDDNFETVVEAFGQLQPREQVRFYIDLLQYGVPKMQAVSIQSELDSLTDEQLNELIEKIQKEHLSNILANEATGNN